MEPDRDGPAPASSRRVAGNIRALALSSVWSRGLVFLWQLVLARWLGSEGYGIYGTIGALLMVAATVTDLGLGVIVVRDVARRPGEGGRYLVATLLLQLPLAALAYAGVLAVAGAVGYPAGLRRLLALAAVLLLIDALGTMCHNQLVARERMAICATIAAGHATLLVGLGALALAFGHGLPGLYRAAVLAGSGRAAAYWVAAWREGIKPAWPADPSLLRALTVQGLPLAGLAFLTIAGLHGDKLITTALLSPAATGQLTAASVVVFGIVELFSTVPLVGVLPLMSRAHAAGVQAFGAILARLAVFTLMAGLPLAISGSTLAVPLAPALFGESFGGSASVLQILVWYAAVAMLANIGAQVLIVRGQQERLLRVRAASLVAGWGLALALLPRMGVTGAGAAMLVAELLALGLLARACRLSRAWWAEVRGRAARLGAAGVALLVSAVALRGISPVLAGAAGLLVYGLVVRSLGVLTTQDQALLRLVVRSRADGGRGPSPAFPLGP